MSYTDKILCHSLTFLFNLIQARFIRIVLNLEEEKTSF